MKNGLTIRDAAERWVHEMNAIPQGMIEKLMNIGDGDIHEVFLRGSQRKWRRRNHRRR